jgi:hypothetical protein
MRGADWLAFIPGRLIYVMLHERNNKGKPLVVDLINAFISSKVHRKQFRGKSVAHSVVLSAGNTPANTLVLRSLNQT